MIFVTKVLIFQLLFTDEYHFIKGAQRLYLFKKDHDDKEDFGSN